MRNTFLLALAPLVSGFMLPLQPAAPSEVVTYRTSALVAGLFDGLLGGSEEEKQQKKQQADEQLQAMKDMQERRRDPVENMIAQNKRRNLELATKAAQAGNIPANWGSAVDPASGDRYFFDAETKENVTWDPTEMIDEMVALLEDQQRAEFREALENS